MHRQSNGFALLTILSLALVSAAETSLANAGEGGSEPAVKTFSIPGQAASQALNEFARQADLTLVFSSELVSGIQTKPLDGSYSIDEALEQMLEGTPLSHRSLTRNTVAISYTPAAKIAQGDGTDRTSMRLAQTDTRVAAGAIEDSLEEVLVTGSNIRSALDAEQRSIPVEVITAEQIGKTGAATLAEVFAKNPAISGGALAEQDHGGRGFVNLRGLGAQYTLVLVNGRRLSANDPANILAIPAEAVARIEILKSGASAVYGSDAVSGVVNVILKSQAEGLHANFSYGDTTQGGASTTDATLFGGAASSEARYFFLINHMSRSEVRSGDRDITASSDMRSYGGFDQRSSIGNPGRVRGVTGFPALILDSARVPAGSYSLDTVDWRPFNAATDLFDTRAVVNPSVISAVERLTIVGNFEQDLFDGRATFFTSGLFWRMKDKFYSPHFGISFANPAIGPVPADNPYNPFGEAVFGVDYRPIVLGRRLDESPAHTYRLSGGIRGEIGAWQLESAASWYRNGFVNYFHDTVSVAGLQAAVNRTTPNAFNPFCNQCNTAEQFAGVLVSSSNGFDFRSDLFDFRASGPLFNLPTGLVRAALGAEYRREGVLATPDPLWESGGVSGFGALFGYDFERTVRSGYAEVKVPLLRAMRGPESPLELSMAGRFEEYSDYGSETSPLTSLRYSLLDGQVMLRASYAKAYLAPYLELSSLDYNGSYGTIVMDPQTGVPTEALVVYSGTPDILAEHATTKNIGLVVNPSMVPGLTLSLDFYRIAQTDLIPAGVNPLAILEGVAPGTVVRGQDIGPNGEDMIVRGYFYNQDRRNSEGYELSINYVLPETVAGRFELDLAINRLEKYETPDANGVLTDIAGAFDITANSFFGSRALPKTRGVGALSWSRGAWSAAAQYNFMSSFREAQSRRVGSYGTADLQLAYALGDDSSSRDGWLPMDGMKLTLGVQNAFDREVPFLAVLNGYNSYENDLRGRFVYGRIAVDF